MSNGERDCAAAHSDELEATGRRYGAEACGSVKRRLLDVLCADVEERVVGCLALWGATAGGGVARLEVGVQDLVVVSVAPGIPITCRHIASQDEARDGKGR